MKRLHVIGGKNHGKTTLIVELVREFARRGFPSCVKSGEAACDQILPKLETNMNASNVTRAYLEARIHHSRPEYGRTDHRLADFICPT